jgi:hypothetical protein
MAYTKMKNARLLVDAVNGLEYYKTNYPLNELMISYYENKIKELTKRVYG